MVANKTPFPAPADVPRAFLRALFDIAVARVPARWRDGGSREDGKVHAALARAVAAGLGPERHLARHDRHGLFSALGDLVLNGPVFTNGNDFRALWIG